MTRLHDVNRFKRLDVRVLTRDVGEPRLKRKGRKG